MTLADEILNLDDRLQLATPFGLPTKFVKDSIRQAQRFQFDATAVEAVINLLRSKPSSLTEAAFQFARPPYDLCWIEWPAPDVTPMLPTQIRAARVGVLLMAENDRRFMLVTAWTYSGEAWRRMRTEDPAGIVESSKVGWSEMAAEIDFSGLPGGSMRLWEPHADPREDAAAARLERHIGFRVIGGNGYPDIVRMYGRELAQSKLADIAQEVKPTIGMLILMGSKNCVDLKPIEPPAQLNKARVKRGRLPLVGYTNVSISLGRRDSRQASAHGVSAEDIRQHLVRGHFKIRKTGVYWWRNHIRGAAAAGTVEHKSYRVTA